MLALIDRWGRPRAVHSLSENEQARVMSSWEKGEKFEGMVIKEIPHDPSEYCVCCGSTRHNTWMCWQSA